MTSLRQLNESTAYLNAHECGFFERVPSDLPDRYDDLQRSVEKGGR
jgi:hypothetical protein